MEQYSQHFVMVQAEGDVTVPSYGVWYSKVWHEPYEYQDRFCI
jgi:hypothetical protein